MGEARNRARRAVERTVTFGLICFSVVTVWYTLHGHCVDDVANHRARARWYTTKTEPSYDDMAVKLRRVIIAARFRPRTVMLYSIGRSVPHRGGVSACAASDLGSVS